MLAKQIKILRTNIGMSQAQLAVIIRPMFVFGAERTAMVIPATSGHPWKKQLYLLPKY